VPYHLDIEKKAIHTKKNDVLLHHGKGTDKGGSREAPTKKSELRKEALLPPPDPDNPRFARREKKGFSCFGPGRGERNSSLARRNVHARKKSWMHPAIGYETENRFKAIA